MADSGRKSLQPPEPSNPEPEDFMDSALAVQAQGLDLLEKFPTLKKADEKKYRAMMDSFIGIINRQQRVIDILKGRLQEQRDLFEKRPASMVSSAPSFAIAVKI
ncbi:hypothetical protein AVEN_174563-1 [Araneus ventricosus]|uniref:Uncharacterized protein n=1 Tax=Araneus ventricosus TaxID=182803 RepID=A0A4Y2UWJ7_ARAVE|nr:hypothetical protein AVEN_174563-1 [Araneus ventricosus]